MPNISCTHNPSLPSESYKILVFLADDTNRGTSLNIGFIEIKNGHISPYYSCCNGYIRLEQYNMHICLLDLIACLERGQIRNFSVVRHSFQHKIADPVLQWIGISQK